MQIPPLFVLFLIAACCTAPAIAAVKYIDSSPDLSASITGSNEFSPGEDATITIVIRNSGLNTFKDTNAGTIERDDLPNTAKLTIVQLLPGTGPLTVKTDPQSVGDIPGGGGTARLAVSAKIAKDAAAGDYTLPLLVRYRYLESTVQEGSDTLQSLYATVEKIIPLTIRIRPRLRITVLSVTTESLNVGTEGYLRLTLRNDGSDEGKMATVTLTRSGTSQIIPTDSSVFIGDFPSGSVVNCTYKVAISADAGEQLYPVDVSVKYKDHEGQIVTSEKVTIGVPVGGKAAFAISSQPPEIAAGQQAVVAVGYRNTGKATAYHVQARISAVPPFTSSDDTAYLGDLQPGQSGTARYQLSVPAGAETREYTLDSEVRSRDALDNSQIADTLKVTVRVIPNANPGNPLTSPVALAAFAVTALGAGYYLVIMRKKK